MTSTNSLYETRSAPQGFEPYRQHLPISRSQETATYHSDAYDSDAYDSGDERAKKQHNRQIATQTAKSALSKAGYEYELYMDYNNPSIRNTLKQSDQARLQRARDAKNIYDRAYRNKLKELDPDWRKKQKQRDANKKRKLDKKRHEVIDYLESDGTFKAIKMDGKRTKMQGEIIDDYIAEKYKGVALSDDDRKQIVEALQQGVQDFSKNRS
jgi:hypothetical protein